MKKLAAALIAAFVLFASPISATEKPKQSKLGDLDCSTDQIAKYSGSEWVCADDQTGTTSSTFDLILIDSETGQQVGVAGAGGDAWKLVAPSGDESVSYGYPSPLPEVSEQAITTTHWLYEVNAYYSCDTGTLLGWGSTWLAPDYSFLFPAEFNDTWNTETFGTLPNGDVVTARVANESSVSWQGDYGNIPGLDPHWDGDSPLPEVYGDCFIAVGVVMGDAENLHKSPFNMTWATTLADITNNARYSAEDGGPFPQAPAIYVTRDLVGGNVNPDNPIVVGLLDNCTAMAGYPCGWISIQSSEPEFSVGGLPSTELKSASYIERQAVVSVTPIAELPGNRGELRSFQRVWR